jgi:hypothetical protein
VQDAETLLEAAKPQKKLSRKKAKMAKLSQVKKSGRKAYMNKRLSASERLRLLREYKKSGSSKALQIDAW